MTINRTSQEKTKVKQKILETLMELTAFSDMSQIRIARRLGYANDVFSQIKSGFSDGSPQLLAGLELLKELTVLKASGVRSNPDFIKELDVMKARIADMEQRVRPHYGEHVPQHLILNEPEEEFSLDPAVKKAAEIANQLGKQSVEKLSSEHEAGSPSGETDAPGRSKRRHPGRSQS